MSICPEEKPDPVSLKCNECNGEGFIYETCCSGENCQCNGIPEKSDCEKCHGSGTIEIDAEEYDQLLKDDKADLENDDF